MKHGTKDSQFFVLLMNVVNLKSELQTQYSYNFAFSTSNDLSSEEKTLLTKLTDGRDLIMDTNLETYLDENWNVHKLSRLEEKLKQIKIQSENSFHDKVKFVNRLGKDIYELHESLLVLYPHEQSSSPLDEKQIELIKLYKTEKIDLFYANVKDLNEREEALDTIKRKLEQFDSSQFNKLTDLKIAEIKKILNTFEKNIPHLSHVISDLDVIKNDFQVNSSLFSGEIKNKILNDFLEKILSFLKCIAASNSLKEKSTGSYAIDVLQPVFLQIKDNIQNVQALKRYLSILEKNLHACEEVIVEDIYAAVRHDNYELIKGKTKEDIKIIIKNDPATFARNFLAEKQLEIERAQQEEKNKKEREQQKFAQKRKEYKDAFQFFYGRELSDDEGGKLFFSPSNVQDGLRQQHKNACLQKMEEILKFLQINYDVKVLERYNNIVDLKKYLCEKMAQKFQERLVLLDEKKKLAERINYKFFSRHNDHHEKIKKAIEKLIPVLQNNSIENCVLTKKGLNLIEKNQEYSMGALFSVGADWVRYTQDFDTIKTWLKDHYQHDLKATKIEEIKNEIEQVYNEMDEKLTSFLGGYSINDEEFLEKIKQYEIKLNGFAFTQNTKQTKVWKDFFYAIKSNDTSLFKTIITKPETNKLYIKIFKGTKEILRCANDTTKPKTFFDILDTLINKTNTEIQENYVAVKNYFYSIRDALPTEERALLWNRTPYPLAAFEEDLENPSLTDNQKNFDIHKNLYKELYTYLDKKGNDLLRDIKKLNLVDSNVLNANKELEAQFALSKKLYNDILEDRNINLGMNYIYIPKENRIEAFWPSDTQGVFSLRKYQEAINNAQGLVDAYNQKKNNWIQKIEKLIDTYGSVFNHNQKIKKLFSKEGLKEKPEADLITHYLKCLENLKEYFEATSLSYNEKLTVLERVFSSRIPGLSESNGKFLAHKPRLEDLIQAFDQANTISFMDSENKKIEKLELIKSIYEDTIKEYVAILNEQPCQKIELNDLNHLENAINTLKKHIAILETFKLETSVSQWVKNAKLTVALYDECRNNPAASLLNFKTSTNQVLFFIKKSSIGNELSSHSLSLPKNCPDFSALVALTNDALLSSLTTIQTTALKKILENLNRIILPNQEQDQTNSDPNVGNKPQASKEETILATASEKANPDSPATDSEVTLGKVIKKVPSQANLKSSLRLAIDEVIVKFNDLNDSQVSSSVFSFIPEPAALTQLKRMKEMLGDELATVFTDDDIRQFSKAALEIEVEITSLSTKKTINEEKRHSEEQELNKAKKDLEQLIAETKQALGEEYEPAARANLTLESRHPNKPMYIKAYQELEKAANARIKTDLNNTFNAQNIQSLAGIQKELEDLRTNLFEYLPENIQNKIVNKSDSMDPAIIALNNFLKEWGVYYNKINSRQPYPMPFKTLNREGEGFYRLTKKITEDLAPVLLEIRLAKEEAQKKRNAVLDAQKAEETIAAERNAALDRFKYLKDIEEKLRSHKGKSAVQAKIDSSLDSQSESFSLQEAHDKDTATLQSESQKIITQTIIPVAKMSLEDYEKQINIIKNLHMIKQDSIKPRGFISSIVLSGAQEDDNFLNLDKHAQGVLSRTLQFINDLQATKITNVAGLIDRYQEKFQFDIAISMIGLKTIIYDLESLFNTEKLQIMQRIHAAYLFTEELLKIQKENLLPPDDEVNNVKARFVQLFKLKDNMTAEEVKETLSQFDLSIFSSVDWETCKKNFATLKGLANGLNSSSNLNSKIAEQITILNSLNEEINALRSYQPDNRLVPSFDEADINEKDGKGKAWNAYNQVKNNKIEADLAGLNVFKTQSTYLKKIKKLCEYKIQYLEAQKQLEKTAFEQKSKAEKQAVLQKDINEIKLNNLKLIEHMKGVHHTLGHANTGFPPYKNFLMEKIEQIIQILSKDFLASEELAASDELQKLVAEKNYYQSHHAEIVTNSNLLDTINVFVGMVRNLKEEVQNFKNEGRKITQAANGIALSRPANLELLEFPKIDNYFKAATYDLVNFKNVFEVFLKDCKACKDAVEEYVKLIQSEYAQSIKAHQDHHLKIIQDNKKILETNHAELIKQKEVLEKQIRDEHDFTLNAKNIHKNIEDRVKDIEGMISELQIKGNIISSNQPLNTEENAFSIKSSSVENIASLIKIEVDKITEVQTALRAHYQTHASAKKEYLQQFDVLKKQATMINEALALNADLKETIKKHSDYSALEKILAAKENILLNPKRFKPIADFAKSVDAINVAIYTMVQQKQETLQQKAKVLGVDVILPKDLNAMNQTSLPPSLENNKPNTKSNALHGSHGNVKNLIELFNQQQENFNLKAKIKVARENQQKIKSPQMDVPAEKLSEPSNILDDIKDTQDTEKLENLLKQEEQKLEQQQKANHIADANNVDQAKKEAVKDISPEMQNAFPRVKAFVDKINALTLPQPSTKKASPASNPLTPEKIIAEIKTETEKLQNDLEKEAKRYHEKWSEADPHVAQDLTVENTNTQKPSIAAWCKDIIDTRNKVENKLLSEIASHLNISSNDAGEVPNQNLDKTNQLLVAKITTVTTENEKRLAEKIKLYETKDQQLNNEKTQLEKFIKDKKTNKKEKKAVSTILKSHRIEIEKNKENLSALKKAQTEFNSVPIKDKKEVYTSHDFTNLKEKTKVIAPVLSLLADPSKSTEAGSTSSQNATTKQFTRSAVLAKAKVFLNQHNITNDSYLNKNKALNETINKACENTAKKLNIPRKGILWWKEPATQAIQREVVSSNDNNGSQLCIPGYIAQSETKKALKKALSKETEKITGAVNNANKKIKTSAITSNRSVKLSDLEREYKTAVDERTGLVNEIKQLEAQMKTQASAPTPLVQPAVSIPAQKTNWVSELIERLNRLRKPLEERSIPELQKMKEELLAQLPAQPSAEVKQVTSSTLPNPNKIEQKPRRVREQLQPTLKTNPTQSQQNLTQTTQRSFVQSQVNGSGSGVRANGVFAQQPSKSLSLEEHWNNIVKSSKPLVNVLKEKNAYFATLKTRGTEFTTVNNIRTAIANLIKNFETEAFKLELTQNLLLKLLKIKNKNLSSSPTKSAVKTELEIVIQHYFNTNEKKYCFCDLKMNVDQQEALNEQVVDLAHAITNQNKAALKGFGDCLNEFQKLVSQLEQLLNQSFNNIKIQEFSGKITKLDMEFNKLQTELQLHADHRYKVKLR